jgi:hypothetical protein
VVRFQVSIQETELSDHPTTYICQKRKANAFRTRELTEHFSRVVADPNQPNATPIELLLDLLQLNELRFAIGSPSRAAVENDQRTPAVAPIKQPERVPVGVGQFEVRENFADRRADLAVVHLGHGFSNRAAPESLPIDLIATPCGIFRAFDRLSTIVAADQDEVEYARDSTSLL